MSLNSCFGAGVFFMIVGFAQAESLTVRSLTLSQIGCSADNLQVQIQGELRSEDTMGNFALLELSTVRSARQTRAQIIGQAVLDLSNVRGLAVQTRAEGSRFIQVAIPLVAPVDSSGAARTVGQIEGEFAVEDPSERILILSGQMTVHGPVANRVAENKKAALSGMSCTAVARVTP